MQHEIINDGNIIRVSVDKELSYTKGMGENIFEKLNSNKHLPMQIDGVTGEVDTYGSVLQRSIRTAIKMRSKGITREDIVTVCSYNHLNTNIPIIASLFLGVKTASIDPSLALSDAIHLLKQVKPKMIFVSENGIKLIEDTIKEIGINSEVVVFGESTEYTKFSEFLNEAPEEEKGFVPVEIKNLKETVSIFFSSGTTGLAKGVCLSHLSLISQLPPKEMEDSFRLLGLSYSSSYWISSIIMLIYTIVTGGCRLVLPKFQIENFWHLIDKYKVSFLAVSATQLATISSIEKPGNVDMSNLKFLSASGAMVYKEHLDIMKEVFPTTLVSTDYGQTELGGGCLYFNIGTSEIKYLLENPTSCGRPQPGYTYKVVDLETEEPLGPNQKGELRVKTDFCMNGYYNVDASNSWDSDDFLKTGDIVYYDEDYCFYVVDRIKDMLKFQGWQIAPVKLESILLTHPDVEVALVIGLPHPTDGDHLTGIIQLKNSAPNVTVEEIQKYYDEKIGDDRQRLRGGLKIVSTIPVTPSGKYKKRCLRDLILSGNI